MDNRMRLALKLARKGIDDETIEEVFGLGVTTPTRPRAQPAAAAKPPQRSEGYRSRAENYDALVDAIAATVIREGTVEGSVRDICDRHRAAWLSCLPNPKVAPTARGFSGVVTSAIEKDAGVLRGILRITEVSRVMHPDGRRLEPKVYRFEAA